jgi:Holliday junction resolvase-like predicted endonuclease
MVAVPRQRTPRTRSGDAAERFAARLLAGRGWTILAANVRIGQDELDLVAIEPGDPACLVFVEVRSNVTNRFGAPEESVVGGKLRRTYRAVWGLLRLGSLPDGTKLPRLPWRVDVLIVEQHPNLARDVGGPTVRHLRSVAPE